MAAPENQTGVRLTDAQVLDYLDCRGTRCPYCRSNDTQTGETVCDGDTGEAPVTCLTCRSEWKDVWGVVGVCELDDPQWDQREPENEEE